MKSNLAKALKQVALGGVLAAAATGSFAATQGTTGFTSTGTVDIDLTVADEVRIFDLVDITLPFTGADVQGTSAACIYRNSGTTYTVTASGSGTAGAFTLEDFPLTNTVPYTVTWDDDGAGPGTPTAMTTGTALPADNAQGSPTTCASGPNATIEVEVLATDVVGLPADTYSGTLTLVVAPI